MLLVIWFIFDGPDIFKIMKNRSLNFGYYHFALISLIRVQKRKTETVIVLLKEKNRGHFLSAFPSGLSHMPSSLLLIPFDDSIPSPLELIPSSLGNEVGLSSNKDSCQHG